MTDGLSTIRVHQIDRLGDFDRIRQDWQRLYAVDQQASVFLHWHWLRNWFEVSPYPWSVLGVMQTSEQPRAHAQQQWIAFLPISPRNYLHPIRIDLVREIHMAGDPAADYTGLLCLPESEHLAIGAIANHLAVRTKWDRIRFKEVSDPRIDRLVELLSSHYISTRSEVGTCCPMIELPRSWSEYLKMLSPDSRKSLKRSICAIEGTGSVSWSTPGTADRDVELLMNLAAQRGLASDELLKQARQLMRAGVCEGFATVAIAWHQSMPIAAQGLLLDHRAQSMAAYISGFDPRFARLSPVKALDGLSIRRAIDEGWKRFDFLRGDEAYKFRFAAQPRYTRHYTCVRRSLSTVSRRAISGLREVLHI